MAKRAYKDPKNLRKATKELLGKITQVVEEYSNAGYTLTLRQLYYQLVTKEILRNEQKQYAKLSKILTDARMCGQIDWDAIEDRIRVPKKASEWRNIESLVDSAIYSYRKDRMRGQENYVEVWVEKDALSGVLEPITQKYHVNLMVNRGYSSVSAMHDSALRIKSQMRKDKNCTILYLGDHDPSGLDMVRDIQERLNEFGCEVEVKQIALTMEQIEEYKPPPNPAKVDDPRADDYIARFGHVSWELDALKPEMLNKLLEDEIEELIDMELYNEVVEEETREKRKLAELAATIDEDEEEGEEVE